MTSQAFHGSVKDGKVLLDKSEAWKEQIARLEGKQIEVRIGARRQNRSLKANSYYWGVIIPYLSDHTGYDREEMHEVLKWRFLRVHDDQFETVRSTSDLDPAQFAVYVEACCRLAAQLGVVIPDPNYVSKGAA